MLEPDLLKIADKTRKGFKRITSSKRPEVTKVLLFGYEKANYLKNTYAE